jgi:hypothetical protein
MPENDDYNRLVEQADTLPYRNELLMQKMQLLTLMRIATALERFVELADREMGSEQ